MKDLLGLRKKDIDKLIKYNFISSEKEAIRNGNFSDGSPEYMVCFDTSDEQYRAYMLIFNNEFIEDNEDKGDVKESIVDENKYIMDDEIELLPCPCCSYSAVLETMQARKGWEATVCCNGCGLEFRTVTFDTKEEAIDNAVGSWNKRELMNNIVKQLECSEKNGYIKAIDDVISKVLPCGSLCVEWNDDMTKEEIAESVLNQSQEIFIDILEKLKRDIKDIEI